MGFSVVDVPCVGVAVTEATVVDVGETVVVVLVAVAAMDVMDLIVVVRIIFDGVLVFGAVIVLISTTFGK